MSCALLHRLTSSTPKRILSLDGGGVRGILMLGFLETLENQLRKRHGRPDMRLSDYFDLIGGTSVGSILAAALAMGMEMKTLTGHGMDVTTRIFARRNWRAWHSRFDSKPLQSVLHDVFGDCMLGDERLATGLCIVTKRADTRSTWPLINHPQGRFYEMNRHILLRDAVYASAAAPYFFVPTKFDVGQGEVGAFVDGGVSMANNPAWQMFLLATLKGFPFHWPTGEDQLLMVSIGTGSWQQRDPVDKVAGAKAWNWPVEVPKMLMEDANTQVQLLMQYMSRTLTPWTLDSEVGDLSGDLLTREPALSYLRYNAKLEREPLAELGFDLSNSRVKALRNMTAHNNSDQLLAIGRVAAREGVSIKHFPPCFDIPKRP